MKNITRDLMHPKNSRDLSTREGLYRRMVDESESFVGLEADLTIHMFLYNGIKYTVFQSISLPLTSKLISDTLN